MIKITNLGKRVRRLMDNGKTIYIQPKEFVLIESIHPSQEFIRDSKIFKIEDDYKNKKGDQ